jgi:hypothetical protein
MMGEGLDTAFGGSTNNMEANVPNRKEEEAALARITAQFYLDRSPFAHDLPEENWRESLRKTHDDTLYYLQRLRPFFMEDVSGEDVSAPEPEEVDEEAEDEAILSLVQPYSRTEILSGRVRTYFWFKPGMNEIVLDVPEKWQRLPIERVFVGGRHYDYQNGFDDAPLFWDFLSNHPFHGALTGRIHYTSAKTLPKMGDMVTLYIRNEGTEDYQFMVDVSFPIGRYSQMPPREFDSLSVDCPTCGAKEGKECFTASGEKLLNFTHRPRCTAQRLLSTVRLNKYL